jgi:hypothetical protein
MRILFFILLLWCSDALALFTDLKFGQSQIADSQWDVGSCTTTTTCNIYSKNPGIAYMIPWFNGQLSWVAGDYVQFQSTGDAVDQWNAIQYDAAGNVKATMGSGHIVSMDTSYFFFVGNDNNTGQLFSMQQGLSNTDAVSWTGTLNPTVLEVNNLSASGSTSPLAAGQSVPPVFVPMPVSLKSIRPLMLGYIPSSTNSASGEFFSNAFDGNPSTKYLNFDKLNTGVMIKLSQGKVISGVTFTTANDSPERDPASFILYGSNDTVTWVVIDSKNISLSDNRFTDSTYTINNINAYVYYNIVFPTVKNAGAANSMQIAEITFIYDENNPTTSVDLGSTLPWTTFPSVYCCGGSGAPFPADIASTVSMLIFKQMPAMNYVGINQTGNDNKITIEQIGSSKNSAVYTGAGNSNTITITQEAINDSQPNYLNLSVNGNFNLVDIDQNSYSVVSNSGKGAFINITDDNNYFTLQQKDNGNHIAYVSLSGGNKHVDILQQGSADHMALVQLSGQPVDLSLQQSGATQQYYSINFNCATVGGCAPIQVQQGQ